MKDKEMIEQMAKDLKTCLPNNWYWQKTVDTDTYFVAKHFHNERYRKLPEGFVVLSREEFEAYTFIKHKWGNQDAIKWSELVDDLYEFARKFSKETAEKILRRIKEIKTNDCGYTDWLEDTYFGDEYQKLAKQFGIDLKGEEQ